MKSPKHLSKKSELHRQARRREREELARQVHLPEPDEGNRAMSILRTMIDRSTARAARRLKRGGPH